MGLNDEDRSKLFKPFFRSSSKENRDANVNSHGIGLNFSKRLANALDGDLTLDPDYRNGCQFIFTINLKRIIREKKQASFKVRGG